MGSVIPRHDEYQHDPAYTEPDRTLAGVAAFMADPRR
jgi:hypothetical protein